MGVAERLLWGLLGLFAATQAAAEPLTLRQALETAAATPELRRAEAGEAAARAQMAAAAVPLGTRLDARARARWTEPPDAFSYLGHDDHAGELVLEKTVWDFGTTRHGRAAAEAGVEAARWTLRDARQARRYRILQAFFQVVLADLTYAWRNEAMSIAYVRFDRERDRARLGQRSELDVARLEAAYQTSREAVYAAQAAQRSTRARLALALGRPGELPSEVVPPDPRALMTPPVPPWEAWRDQVLAQDPEIRAARARVEAARARLRRVGARPSLALEAKTGLYTRNSPGNGPWQAGVGLSWPLWTGGAVAAERADARARLAAAQAELEAVEQKAEQAALEDWLALGRLQAAWEAAESELRYRELDLDRARLRYEQEVESDLGDAMVELSAAQLRRHRVAYEHALARARLLARAGRLLEYDWP